MSTVENSSVLRFDLTGRKNTHATATSPTTLLNNLYYSYKGGTPKSSTVITLNKLTLSHHGPQLSSRMTQSLHQTRNVVWRIRKKSSITLYLRKFNICRNVGIKLISLSAKTFKQTIYKNLGEFIWKAKTTYIVYFIGKLIKSVPAF